MCELRTDWSYCMFKAHPSLTMLCWGTHDDLPPPPPTHTNWTINSHSDSLFIQSLKQAHIIRLMACSHSFSCCVHIYIKPLLFAKLHMEMTKVEVVLIQRTGDISWEVLPQTLLIGNHWSSPVTKVKTKPLATFAKNFEEAVTAPSLNIVMVFCQQF